MAPRTARMSAGSTPTRLSAQAPMTSALLAAPPSGNATASRRPTLAPDGAAALPMNQSFAYTSTSTVREPRLL